MDRPIVRCADGECDIISLHAGARVDRVGDIARIDERCGLDGRDLLVGADVAQPEYLTGRPAHEQVDRSRVVTESEVHAGVAHRAVRALAAGDFAVLRGCAASPEFDVGADGRGAVRVAHVDRDPVVGCARCRSVIAVEVDAAGLARVVGAAGDQVEVAVVVVVDERAAVGVDHIEAPVGRLVGEGEVAVVDPHLRAGVVEVVDLWQPHVKVAVVVHIAESDSRVEFVPLECAGSPTRLVVDARVGPEVVPLDASNRVVGEEVRVVAYQAADVLRVVVEVHEVGGHDLRVAVVVQVTESRADGMPPEGSLGVVGARETLEHVLGVGPHR